MDLLQKMFPFLGDEENVIYSKLVNNPFKHATFSQFCLLLDCVYHINHLGLTQSILTLLSSLDWTSDLGDLQKNAALGDAQHVSTLRLLHADTRQNLADCLYGYAAQSGLPCQDTVK